MLAAEALVYLLGSSAGVAPSFDALHFPKIGHLAHPSAAHEHVERLEVAVDEVVVVKEGHAECDVRCDREQRIRPGHVPAHAAEGFCMYQLVQ